MDNRVDGRSFCRGALDVMWSVWLSMLTQGNGDSMEDNQFCVYMSGGGDFCARGIGLLAPMIDSLSVVWEPLYADQASFILMTVIAL